jgi:hypothetical protein
VTPVNPGGTLSTFFRSGSDALASSPGKSETQAIEECVSSECRR